MIYVWESNTGHQIEIERKISEYNQGPTEEEVLEWADNNDIPIEYLTKITEWSRMLVGGSLTINFGLKGRYNSQS